MECPVLCHVAVVVASAVERQQGQHAAKSRPHREPELRKSLPAP
jgi:hypothetical protein